MAEGFLRDMHGEHYEVFSAGTLATAVNPFAIETMKEMGIDISKARSKEITEFRDKKFSFVITVCDRARESCPFFPSSSQNLHVSFEDPASLEGSDEAKLQKFRQVRDKIKSWIDGFFGNKSDP